MRIIIVLCLILACFTRASSQSNLSGPLDVCEYECHLYTFTGAQPAYWTIEGGLVTENIGSEIEICWQEAQQGGIEISSLDGNVEASLVINIEAKPDPSISFPLVPFCQTLDSLFLQEKLAESENCKKVCGGNLAFYDAVGFDNSIFNWIVQGANGVTNVDNGIEVLWPDEGFGSILLVEETAAGCIDSSFVCIEIIDKPSLSIIQLNDQISLSSVCQNQNIYLEANSDKGTNFYWTSSDGQTATGTNATFSFSNSGNYKVELHATTDCLCEISTEITINVIDFVSPLIDCVGTLCANSETTYYAADICGQYNWQIEGDATIIEGGGTSDNYLTVNWETGPEGFIILSTSACEDPNICTQPAVELIPILDSSVSISGQQEVCSFTQSTYHTINYEGSHYNWSINNGAGYIVKGNGTNQITVQWYPTYQTGQTEALIEVQIDNCFLGCSSEGSINVAIKDKFSITADPDYCEGSEAYFYAFSGFFNANVDWVIITPTGDVITLDQATNYTNFTLDYGPGFYELYASQTTGEFCNEEFRTGFNVHPDPEMVTDIIGSEYVCKNQGYSYSILPASSDYIYEWQIKDGTNTQDFRGEEIFVQWTSDGPYSISVTVFSNSTGCSSERYFKDLEEVAQANILGDNIACQDDFTDYTLQNVEGFDIEWSTVPANTGTIVKSSESEVTVQWHTSGFTTLRAEYCGQTFDLNITVTNFSYTIVNPDELCEGEFGEINVSPPTGGSFRVFNELDAFIGDVNPIVVGPGFYGVEVYDINGCRAYSNLFIDSHESPAVNISSREWGNLCTPGGTAEIEALSTAEGLSYSWFKNGVSIGADSPKLLVDEEDQFSVIVTDQNGCTAEHSVYVECREGRCDCRPDGGVSFSYSRGQYCNDFDFTNTSIAYIPGTLSYNFGDPDSGANNTSNDENPSHTFTKAGHFPVVIFGTVPSAADPNQTCSASFLDIVTVEMVADFDYIPGCENTAIQFIDKSNFLPDYSISNYQWDFGEPSSGAANNSSGANPTHTYSSAGIYEVSLITTSSGGCQSETKKTITIHGGPVLDFNFLDPTCVDEPVQFFGDGDAPMYGWDFDDSPNQYSINKNAYHNYSNPGIYNVRFFGENVFGCRTEITKAVEIYNNDLTGDIVMDQTMPMCEGEFVTLDAPANGIAYLWSNGETTKSITTDQPGIYSVTIVSSDGCEYIPQAVFINTIKPIYPDITGYIYDDNFFGQAEPQSLEICQFEAFDLGVGFISNANNYIWSNGDTGSYLSSSETAGLSPGEHEFIVTVTHSPTGCAITSEPYIVTIYPLPDPFTIVSNQSDMCEGPEFTSSVDNPNSDLRYFWNNGEEGTSITTFTPGSYYVEAVTDFGCTRISNVLSINPLPNIDRMLSGCQEVCFPDTLCIAEAFEATNFQWFLDGNELSGSNSSTLIINDIGEYQVMMESAFGCTIMSDVLSISPETKEQSLSGLVFIDTNGNSQHDAGEQLIPGISVNIFSGNTLLQTTSTDANGLYLFDPLISSNAMVVIDTFGLSLNFSQTTLVYNFESKSCIEDLEQNFPCYLECVGDTLNLTLFTCPGESIEYENEMYDAFDTAELISTDVNGCTSTINLEVLPFDIEPFQLSTNNSCEGFDNGTLSISTNNGSGLEFSIDGGSNFFNNTEFSNLSPGPYTLIAQDINGCLSQEDFVILENQAPSLFLVTQETCDDDSNGSLIITNNSNSNLEFAVDDPTNMTQITTIDNLSAGNHILYVIDEFACMYEFDFMIDIISIPMIDVNVGSSCEGEANGVLEIIDPASANYEYSIDTSNGFTDNTSFQDLGIGEHNLFITDVNGCVAIQTFTITAYTEPELSLVPSQSCANEELGSLTINTNESGLMYSIDGMSFTNNFEYQNLSVGNHSLIVTTPDNCNFEFSFTIDAYPDFNYNLDLQGSCQGSNNGSLQILDSGGLSYSLDGIDYQNESNFENLSTGNYYLYILDENNCASIDSFSIEEIQQADLIFNDPPIDCSTDQVELMVETVDDSLLTYQWSTGDVTESLIVTESGMYELSIDDGCSVRSQIWDIQFDNEHSVKNPAYVPNIFTPESQDGNQELRPLIHEDIELLKYQFSIFDRWGNKLFDSESQSEFWDGNFNNKEVDPGVFVWKIELEYTTCQESINYKKFGDVTLVK